MIQKLPGDSGDQGNRLPDASENLPEGSFFTAN
jgi:hypothetical protein